jgi:hypothetical protein
MKYSIDRIRLLALMLPLLAGCFGAPSTPEDEPSSSKSGAPRPPRQAELVSIDEEATPEEKKYLEAGKPFLVALVKGDHPQAYNLLSSHAKSRMSINQFVAPEDEAQIKANEENPIQNVTAEQFAEQLRGIEAKFGKARKAENLHVQSLDPKILAGQVSEPLEKLDVMFAIGMMPASVPTDIRRASLRGTVRTDWKPEDLKAAAEALNTTEAEVLKNEDGPYFNLKLVLVEEDGALKVGYFEFLPPSMLD